jgi:CheY-like chemotaxis protein
MAKILMIDDDLESIVDLKDVLTSKYDVDVEDNINGAVDLLSQNAYDLLFLDLYMPHGTRYTSEEAKLGRETGYLLLREIRSATSGFQTSSNVPVIVLTFIRMNMDADLKERVLKEQPIQILEKPESLNEIIGRVEFLLKENPSK